MHQICPWLTKSMCICKHFSCISIFAHAKSHLHITSCAHAGNYESSWTRGLIYPLAVVIYVLLSLLCCYIVRHCTRNWLLFEWMINRNQNMLLFPWCNMMDLQFACSDLHLFLDSQTHASQPTASKGALKGPRSAGGQQVSFKSLCFFVIRLKPGMRHGASVVARFCPL